MSIDVLEPKPSIESYGRRVKRLELPVGTLEALLTMNGDHSYRMDGWPEGAKIVGLEARRNPFMVILYLYHPDFPVNSGLMRPPAVRITATRVD